MKLREIDHVEYMTQLEVELDSDGLTKSIQKRLDMINSELVGMPYVTHMWVIEQMTEIADLLAINDKLIGGNDENS